jgi:hypothetical protein
MTDDDPVLPAPNKPPLKYLLRLDEETSRVLHEIGGLRTEPAGRVARKLLALHAPAALEKERAARLEQGA